MLNAVAAVASLAAAVLGGAGAAPARAPNVLFLLSDDQRADTIHALGNPIIETPHLDQLVRDGTVFPRAVSPNPLCVPARAEILTGCSTLRGGKIQVGLPVRAGQPLWPETMRRAGYRTWYVGKWHSAGRVTDRGYEATHGLFGAGGGPVQTCPLDYAGRPVTGYRGWIFQTDAGQKQPERGVGLTPDISRHFADAAIELIRSRPSAPFFLHVNFTAPHDPLLLPPGYEAKYDPARMPLPVNFQPQHPFDHGNQNGRDEQLLPLPRTAADVRRETAAYYAVIAHLDAQIGRIVEALRETEQLDSTLIIFASDQGVALGSHGLRGKQNMYEHTIGVPLILRGPGIPPGRSLPAQCYLRDLYPTVCELAGIAGPTGIDGRSLAPVLRGEQETVYPCVLGYFGNVQRMIRTDRWKLICYPQLPRWQLFDLRDDPDERHDLAGDPAHAAVQQELQTQLATWRKEMGD